jgi:proteasome beta subunit
VTVVLGLRCAEGLVLATDSQATAQMPGGVPVRMDAPKIDRVGNSIIFGGTGSEGVGQRVKAVLDQQASKMGKNSTRAQIGQLIHSLVNPLQVQARQAFVQMPGAEIDAWGGIFCGLASDGLFLMEIDVAGGWQFHDNQPFTATGSGHAFAHLAVSSVRHHRVDEQGLETAKAIAYRAIENVCLASAYGVGLPVQMAIATESEVRKLDDEELDELGEFVNLWKRREVETLGELAPTTASQSGPARGDEEGRDPGEPGLEKPA